VRAKHVGILVDGAVKGDFRAVLEANHSRAAMQNLELVVPGKANGYKNVDVGRGGVLPESGNVANKSEEFVALVCSGDVPG
jgi:hypothetical protein